MLLSKTPLLLIFCLAVPFISLGQKIPKLPPPFKLPMHPTSGNLGCSTCPFSNKSNSKPSLNYLTYASYKINLQEEEDILPSQLLEIHFGSSTPFSPESRYLLHPPGSKNGFKDYLLVELGIYKVLFKAKVDDLGALNFFSSNYPGYAVRRSDKHLVVTDFNTSREYLFTSFDGGKSWKLEILRDRYQPSRAITCKYNNEGLMEEIVLPGNLSYKIEHKFGVAQKVTSPSGAVTTFGWSEMGTIENVKTVLSTKHPFYQFAKGKQGRKKKFIFNKKSSDKDLPLVRDLFVECDINGRLTGLITNGGEKYTVEYTRDASKKGIVVTGIITFPDGTRKFRMNNNSKGKRVSSSGIIVNKEGKPQFITLSSESYIRKNKGLAFVGKMKNGGLYKYKRQAGTLAITEETNPLRETTKYKYNKFGLRNITIFPDKSRTKREYDDKANLVKEIDECGRVKQWKRNKSGKLIEYAKGGLLTKYEYDSSGRPVKTILPDGTVHLFKWDKQSRLVSYIMPQGIETQYIYFGTLDHISQISIIASDKKAKYTQKYAYDIQGRLTRIDYPDKTYKAFTYDCCNMVTQRSRSGAITKYKYNQSHRKTQKISPNNDVTSYTYDNRGNLTKITYPNKTSLSYKYNKYGQSISQIQPNGLIEKFKLDAMGRRIKMIKQNGTYAQFKYDKRGRIGKITGDLQQNIRYYYDKSGKIIKFCDYGLPASSVPRVTKHKYDKAGRRILSTNPQDIQRYIVYSPSSSQINYIKTGDIYRFNSYKKTGQLLAVSEVTNEELKQALTKAEKQKLLLSKRIKVNDYDKFGNLHEVKDGKGYLIARYDYQPDGVLNSVLYPRSSNYAELFSYRYRYSNDGERITSVYKKLVPLSQAFQ